MGKVLHGSATTTHAVRKAIQRSKAAIKELSQTCGINPKTVRKWRKRNSVEDHETGPGQPRSTFLGEDEEALIIAFRRHTLLPLDDCLHALKPTLPHLTRSSLHRCLRRHDISRLPLEEGDKPERKRFKHCPIGYFHVDIAELRTAEGKLHRFIAIDRTSKFAFARLVERANTKAAAAFLDGLVAAVPCQVHTVLTDDGIEFADLARNRSGATARLRGHLFERACRRHGIEHRLTKPNHPWTNAQTERLNRTVEEATVKRFHDESHARLRRHLDDFLSAYNFARRLKTLRGLTPYEYICKVWTSEPQRFRVEPNHLISGPYSAGSVCKLVHNMIGHGVRQAIAEGLTLGVRPVSRPRRCGSACGAAPWAA